jgi:hypothetical protein
MRRRPEGLAERLPALVAAQDRDLAGARLRRAPGLDVERHSDPPRAILDLPAGIEGRRRVAPELADAVERLDGSPLEHPPDGLAALVRLGYVELA